MMIIGGSISTAACLYDNDGAGNKQALISTDLTAGKRYFIVVSTFDITMTYGPLDVLINKVS